MSDASNIPERIASSQSKARALDARINELTAPTDLDALHAAILELENEATDLFSTFEARMQHHFKRGPFSRKLKARLIEAGQTELADRLHQFYLAINVLKHGKGASQRELLASPSPLIKLRTTQTDEDANPALGLVDVTAAGFFDDLSATISDAYTFLQNA